MITLGIVKFDIHTGNEPFALWLNGRWNSFFTTAFERVVDEVLSAYDTDDRIITIDSLPLHLGTLPEEDFERHFAARLRNALNEYMRKWVDADHSVALQAGVHLETVKRAALDVLRFFLLHGYLPNYASAEYTDLHWLLENVISESAYAFREFLESYGHYDFLCRRLVFSFTDDELEEIVRVVQPSESKFVILYVRVQLRSSHTLKRSDIARDEYRNVVWTLVLAYLFAESRTRFSRKQIMMHTLRGIAAHFNLKFAELARLMTEGIQQLEPTVMQLPELWSLLKEIRRDVQAELYALDGDYRRHLLREIRFALQADGQGDATFTLSYQHIYYVLSTPSSCRELLRQLQEAHIHRLVGIVAPAEKEYIITYAVFLDRHKDSGTFTGKAGSDFRLLKWEFIFAVLLSLPATAFGRKHFVLSVVQRLAAHYNLTVNELIHLLAQEEAWKGASLSSELLRVLQALDNELNGDTGSSQLSRNTGNNQPGSNMSSNEHPNALTAREYEALLAAPYRIRTGTEKEIELWILALFGATAGTPPAGREPYLEKWLIGLLNERNATFRTLWRAGRLNVPLVLLLVNRTPALRNLWLHRIGDERLLVIYRQWRAAYAALSHRYGEYGFLEPASEYLSAWMVELTSRNYSAWSEAEITHFLMIRLQQILPPGLISLIDPLKPVMGKHPTEIINYINKLKNKELMTDSVNSSSMISMHNAGLVLISPYLPMLFSRLGYLTEDRKSFKNTEAMIRAAFLLQYIAYGEEREWPETELFLNKLLIGLEGFNIPLPRSVALSQEEKNMVEDMLKSICNTWDKMRRTSMPAFRMSFLQREGYATLQENENVWEMKVAEKAYDVLLDSIPWGFKMIRYPWILYRMAVRWR